jgi:hypothetical protein
MRTPYIIIVTDAAKPLAVAFAIAESPENTNAFTGRLSPTAGEPPTHWWDCVGLTQEQLASVAAQVQQNGLSADDVRLFNRENTDPEAALALTGLKRIDPPFPPTT